MPMQKDAMQDCRIWIEKTETTVHTAKARYDKTLDELEKLATKWKQLER